MAEEKQSIFRKKSIESVQSPEVLDDYLKVTNPGIWIFLTAVALLLIGVIIWGIFGSIDTKVDVVVEISDGNAVCYIPYEDMKGVSSSGIITIGEKEYKLSDAIGYEVVSDEINTEIMVKGGLESGDVVVYVPVDGVFDGNGITVGTVVTESLKPISLLLQ